MTDFLKWTWNNDMCQFCGLRHGGRRCSAWNAQCMRCKNYGHFARACRRVKYSVNTCSRDFEKNRKARRSPRNIKRDQQRLEEFIRRKTASQMPYPHVEDRELARLSLNQNTTTRTTQPVATSDACVQTEHATCETRTYGTQTENIAGSTSECDTPTDTTETAFHTYLLSSPDERASLVARHVNELCNELGDLARRGGDHDIPFIESKIQILKKEFHRCLDEVHGEPPEQENNPHSKTGPEVQDNSSQTYSHDIEYNLCDHHLQEYGYMGPSHQHQYHEPIDFQSEQPNSNFVDHRTYNQRSRFHNEQPSMYCDDNGPNSECFYQPPPIQTQYMGHMPKRGRKRHKQQRFF